MAPRDLEDIHEKLNDIHAILVGKHDPQGQYHPGLSARVARLESFAAWLAGILTTAVASVIGAWALLGSGPRPPAGHP